jgi:cell division protease FtsH
MLGSLVGFKLPDGAKLRVAAFEGSNWQIVETQGNGRALVAHDELARRWIDTGLIELGLFSAFDFGDHRFWAISCGSSHLLCPVTEGKSPDTKAESLSFALALKATREIDPESPLQDALYVEKISRLLPTYSISSRTDDDLYSAFG